MATSTCCSGKCTAAKPDLRFQYGKKKNGQWYWRIRAKNGEIIAASSGEGYKRSAKAVHVAELLRDWAGGMSVENLTPSGVVLKHQRRLTGIGS